jgi:hypothetical protein
MKATSFWILVCCKIPPMSLWSFWNLRRLNSHVPDEVKLRVIQECNSHWDATISKSLCEHLEEGILSEAVLSAIISSIVHQGDLSQLTRRTLNLDSKIRVLLEAIKRENRPDFYDELLRLSLANPTLYAFLEKEATAWNQELSEAALHRINNTHSDDDHRKDLHLLLVAGGRSAVTFIVRVLNQSADVPRTWLDAVFEHLRAPGLCECDPVLEALLVRVRLRDWLVIGRIMDHKLYNHERVRQELLPVLNRLLEQGYTENEITSLLAALGALEPLITLIRDTCCHTAMKPMVTCAQQVGETDRAKEALLRCLHRAYESNTGYDSYYREDLFSSLNEVGWVPETAQELAFDFIYKDARRPEDQLLTQKVYVAELSKIGPAALTPIRLRSHDIRAGYELGKLCAAAFEIWQTSRDEDAVMIMAEAFTLHNHRVVFNQLASILEHTNSKIARDAIASGSCEPERTADLLARHHDPRAADIAFRELKPRGPIHFPERIVEQVLEVVTEQQLRALAAVPDFEWTTLKQDPFYVPLDREHSLETEVHNHSYSDLREMCLGELRRRGLEPAH